MSDEQLRFYDVQDGDDSILITDGEIGTYADKSDFVGKGGNREAWQIMKILRQTMPMSEIYEKETPRDTWIEVDDRGNPLH